MSGDYFQNYYFSHGVSDSFIANCPTQGVNWLNSVFVSYSKASLLCCEHCWAIPSPHTAPRAGTLGAWHLSAWLTSAFHHPFQVTAPSLAHFQSWRRQGPALLRWFLPSHTQHSPPCSSACPSQSHTSPPWSSCWSWLTRWQVTQVSLRFWALTSTTGVPVTSEKSCMYASISGRL